MAVHVAILQRPYLEMILAGTKRVESRLTRSAAPPFGRVSPGDRLFLKLSGGGFRATAVAGEVHSFRDLTPEGVDELARRFRPSVGGDDDYWQAKRVSRCASFIELEQVEPLAVGPAYEKSGWRAWHVLPDDASPLREVTLTSGAIANGYVSVAGEAGFFSPGRFTLELPGGERVETDLYRGRRIRWRGWRVRLRHAGLKAGDRVRFVALGDGLYRVCWIYACRERDQREMRHG
ncbi:MAG: ASCH domain-containing protein [Phycisphaeraceae bacterium]